MMLAGLNRSEIVPHTELSCSQRTILWLGYKGRFERFAKDQMHKYVDPTIATEKIQHSSLIY